MFQWTIFGNVTIAEYLCRLHLGAALVNGEFIPISRSKVLKLTDKVLKTAKSNFFFFFFCVFQVVVSRRAAHQIHFARSPVNN